LIYAADAIITPLFAAIAFITPLMLLIFIVFAIIAAIFSLSFQPSIISFSFSIFFAIFTPPH